MKIEEYLLRKYREEMPEWLANYSKKDPFPFRDFFRSRIVYYPGSQSDGHPLKVFGSSHSAHCFIYADYIYPLQQMMEDLKNVHAYKVISLKSFRFGFPYFRKNVTEQVRKLFEKHSLSVDYYGCRYGEIYNNINRHNGIFAVLERNKNYNDEHGAKRLAFIYLFKDAIEGYVNLFCDNRSRYLRLTKVDLFAMLLQDHGLGCNYAHFGKDSILEDIAMHYEVYPELLLSDTSQTIPWSNYTEIEGVDTSIGGNCDYHRTLFERQTLKNRD